MKKSFKTTCIALILLAVSVFPLCACSGNTAAKPGFSTGIELLGTMSGDAMELRYPSGEAAASLPLDAATAGFPGKESSAAEQGEERPTLPVFYGAAPSGLCWAVVCSGPALGTMHSNVLISADGGETWELASSSENTPHDVVTGAGFQDREHGFLCCRYSEDSGPVIYATADGGSSWARLELDVPAAYENWKKTPLSPIITEKSVCFPVQLRDENEITSMAYCSSTDINEWIWSEQW